MEEEWEPVEDVLMEEERVSAEAELLLTRSELNATTIIDLDIFSMSAQRRKKK